MLIPFTILVRESASDPPKEAQVAINPHAVARVEESEEEGVVQWWADGSDNPFRTRATVEEFAAYVNGFCVPDDEEEEPCEPEPSITE